MGKRNIIPIFVSIFTLVFLFSGISYASLVDDSFNPDVNREVQSIAVQADGKILVGGWFTAIGGQTRSYLARLNADGTLDELFNPDVNPGVFAIAVQADGKILVGGNFTSINSQAMRYLARLNPDGTLDTTFASRLNGLVDHIVLQADGKILVGGDFSVEPLTGQWMNLIGRLNADGSADATFNPDANSDVQSIAVQADGKILVGGWFTAIGGQTRSYLARLNTDGSADATFNPDANSDVSSIAVQADGKILVGGIFTNIGGKARNRIARLNTDGSADATFNPDADRDVQSIAVQADGKILVSGSGSFTSINSQAKLYLARFNVDGTLDAPFNPDVNSTVSTIAVQADGKILVGGFFTTIGGQERHYIARLNAEVTLYNSKDYLPLEPGTIWKYLKNGKRTVTRVVLNKEVTVNGVKTRPVKFVEENVTEYLTSDENGIFLHRQYQPHIYVAGVGWVDVDATFVPPIKLSESEVWIGQSSHSAGTAITGVWPMGDTYYFGYRADSIIEAEEQVTVPAGTFDTIRYHESISSYGEKLSVTRYLAKGIGIVKDISTNPQRKTSTFELISITRLTLLTPNGGEIIPSGGTYDITWESSPDMTTFQLKYSIDDGATWIPIPGAEHVMDNHYLWTVPIPVNNKSCRIKVTGYNAANILLETDVSEAPFTIGVVQVTSPNAGEVWTSGELRSVTWMTNETIRPVAEVRLYYTKNNGITWLPITTITGSNPETYDWIVPPLPKTKTNCKVKVALKDIAEKSIGNDTSEYVFTIQPPP